MLERMGLMEKDKKEEREKTERERERKGAVWSVHYGES